MKEAALSRLFLDHGAAHISVTSILAP